MDANHNARTFPTRGSRRIRGASFDVSEQGKSNIINFPLASYTCLAEEICPVTGRPHLQFYIVCKNAVRLSTLRTHILDAHFDACDSSHAANILYVLKQRDSDYDEWEAAHPGDEDYQGNAATFQEKGERPDEKQQAARTLECLIDCQNFYQATANHMHESIRQEWFGKICHVTDSLCDLMDMCEFNASDEEDSDIDMAPSASKKRKTNA